MVIAFPRTVGAGLAAGVADLDAGDRACGLDTGSNVGHALDLCIVPQAGAARRDTAFGRDCGCFHDDQAGAATGNAGVVRLMPIVDEAVIGGVLAHWRHRDTVAQSDIFEGERGKQGCHEFFVFLT
jgi:hypothetical protein